MANKISTQEKRREIVFSSGQRLNLHNVEAYDPSGTMLRIWTDEGMAVINPANVDYHLIKADI